METANIVNSENFVKVLFSTNFVDVKFRENEVLKNGEITLPFTDVRKSCFSGVFLMSQICLLTLFTKITLAKIS